MFQTCMAKNWHSQEVCYYIGWGSWNVQNNVSFQFHSSQLLIGQQYRLREFVPWAGCGFTKPSTHLTAEDCVHANVSRDWRVLRITIQTGKCVRPPSSLPSSSRDDHDSHQTIHLSFCSPLTLLYSTQCHRIVCRFPGVLLSISSISSKHHHRETVSYQKNVQFKSVAKFSTLLHYQ